MKHLVNLLFQLAIWPLEALLLMLLVGVARGEWLSALPTMGYTAALIITAIASALFSAWRLAFRVGDHIAKS